jgi:hypothetical protein
MEIIGNKTHPGRKLFSCEFCNFNCYNKKDFNRHLQTKKHKNLSEEKQKKDEKKTKNTFSKKCIYCNKSYKTDSGLWKHQQKCKDNTSNTNEKQNNNNEEDKYKQLILDVIHKNNELQKLLVDQAQQHTKNLEKIIPKLQSSVTNNHTTNNMKNEVNVNIFLNEHCKDALNISDFVHSLQVKFDDLENTSKVGFADGISQIFINGLKDLDIYKRPLHCSDLHKKILYVKDKDVWEMNDKQFRLAVESLNEKNAKNILPLMKENMTSNLDEHNTKIITENVANNETIHKSMDKIIKNVAQEVVIDSDN